MSKFVTLHGFGGGISDGANLNFDIVGGTTQPVNPKENVIWVNTDIVISSWAFGATEPSILFDDMIWILTGTSSLVSFDLLKENSMIVYPLAAKQYISGAWVDMTAKLYQGGKWNDLWDCMLYNEGNMYEHITGGWIDGDGNPAAHITNSAECLTIQMAGSSGAMGYAKMVNKIDLTNVESITLEAASSTTAKRCKFVIRGDGVNASSTNIENTTRQTHTIDTSTLSGEYEIWCRIDFSETANFYMYVYRIQLNYA